MLIAAHIMIALGFLAEVYLLVSALKYMLVFKQEAADKKRYIRQHPRCRAMASVNPIAYFTMILYSFFPELGNTTAADGNFRCVLYSVALFALWVLGMFGFNWKVEIFDDYFVHTNFLGIKKQYGYDKIEIRKNSSCDRIFVDGKYKLTISHLLENRKAIEVGRAWYLHRLKQVAKRKKKESENVA